MFVCSRRASVGLCVCVSREMCKCRFIFIALEVAHSLGELVM